MVDVWALFFFTVELTSGGVESACDPSEVGEMSTSVLVTEGTTRVVPSGNYSKPVLHMIAAIKVIPFKVVCRGTCERSIGRC